MIELLDDLPDQVLGARATGEITDDDYEDVLVPAMEDRLSRHDKIRFLYILGEGYEGYEADAMWEDAKLGMKHFTSFERVAVVTDSGWMRNSIAVFGWLMPGEVRGFSLDELEEAKGWISRE